MTVAELIEELKKQPQDAKVVTLDSMDDEQDAEYVSYYSFDNTVRVI